MPKWQINLNNQGNSSQLRTYQHLPQPFGFSTDATQSYVQLPSRKQMINNKLFEVATAQKGQILMTLFMFWMFGNTISIFILFSIFQSLFTSVSSLLKFNKVFEPYEHLVPSLLKYKAMYLGINIIILGIVVNKLSNMGLLPVSPTDYIDLIPPYRAVEVAVGF